MLATITLLLYTVVKHKLLLAMFHLKCVTRKWVTTLLNWPQNCWGGECNNNNITGFHPILVISLQVLQANIISTNH